MIRLVSKSSKKLSKSELKNICFLKDEEWKHGIKSQQSWFKKNVKTKDLHNCFYIKKKLIGYTLLRKRTLKISIKEKEYLLFDSLVISKKFRKRRFSSIMMMFNNNVIIKSKKPSFLICSKRLINFYKKFSWKKLSNYKFKVLDHPFNTNGMLFDYSNKYAKIKGINFYFNK